MTIDRFYLFYCLRFGRCASYFSCACCVIVLAYVTYFLRVLCLMQGHREFQFGKLKIPPPLLHKIPENSR